MLDVLVFKVNTNVANESQPVALNKFAVCEPALLNVNPFHVYGSSDGQTLAVLFEVTTLVTVSINVAAESHPALLIKLAVCEPAETNVNPFQEYGRSDGQTLWVLVETLGLLIVSVIVAAESHPSAFIKCAVCAPALLNVSPFHTKGKSVVQSV